MIRRFRRWRAYRKFLAVLIHADRRAGRPLTRERIEAHKTDARCVARVLLPLAA